MRVVIAEDLALLRDGLTRLLTAFDFEVVAAVDNGPALLPALLEHRPDVAVVDVRLPPTFKDEGLQAAIAARAQVPGLPVLVLSQHVEQLYARELLADRSGGVGYLLKDRVSDVRQFVDAVRQVAAGGMVMDPEVVSQLLARRTADDPLAALTAARARGARRSWPRAAPTRPSAAACSSPRRRSASTSTASSASSACHRPMTTTAGSWPCSPTSTPDPRLPPPSVPLRVDPPQSALIKGESR